MDYKGIKLKEVTEPQLFDPPKKMLVWESYENITELNVYAIVGRKNFPVICENSTWRHCAEIPKVPELEIVTYRELSRWLAEGNGEVMWANNVLSLSNWNYSPAEESKALDESLSVRKWDDTEWHKPTREYLELED